MIVTAAGDDGEHAIVSRFLDLRWASRRNSATGSAHCALASWWAPRLGDTFRARQVSARGATIDVQLAGDRVRLRAGAVTVLSGEL